MSVTVHICANRQTKYVPSLKLTCHDFSRWQAGISSFQQPICNVRMILWASKADLLVQRGLKRMQVKYYEHFKAPYKCQVLLYYCLCQEWVSLRSRDQMQAFLFSPGNTSYQSSFCMPPLPVCGFAWLEFVLEL